MNISLYGIGLLFIIILTLFNLHDQFVPTLRLKNVLQASNIKDYVFLQ